MTSQKKALPPLPKTKDKKFWVRDKKWIGESVDRDRLPEIKPDPNTRFHWEGEYAVGELPNGTTFTVPNVTRHTHRIDDEGRIIKLDNPQRESVS